MAFSVDLLKRETPDFIPLSLPSK